MKYEVQTKFVFKGKFTVVADNSAQAKELVQSYCWMNIGKIHSNLMDEDTDWDFDMHPDKIIGKVRKIKEEVNGKKKEV